MIIKCISDIDECVENACDQKCNNTNGSFICLCNNGYVLDDNGRSCNGMYTCVDNYQLFTTVHFVYRY